MRSARSKGLKDKAYLEFIANLPCVVCLSKFEINASPLYQKSAGWLGKSYIQETHTEVAHVGDRGLSQKCSDRETLPLCVVHHRTGKEAHHVLGKKFWGCHRLDRDILIKTLNEKFDSQRGN